MNLQSLAEYIAKSLPGRLGDHSLRVGRSLRNPRARQEGWSFPEVVGYLHDTVEDGYMTLLGIRALFGKTVSDAVDSVTHRTDQGETYEDYVTKRLDLLRRDRTWKILGERTVN